MPGRAMPFCLTAGNPPPAGLVSLVCWQQALPQHHCLFPS